ncbi:MAG TPA: MDR family MFS transporter [Dehalococcoidia bacterium]|nr:MDR family MFS transporter [Dehalococcoidia bacterium]
MIDVAPATNRARLVIMSGVMLGLLLSALDQTIVSTAMPRIIADLGGLSYYSWVFTAYLLTSTAAVPIFGKLSDVYGRKPFYMAGIVAFLASSALCGLAQNMPELVLFRAIQGVGGGVMMANAFAIIGDVFPPAERGKWQGLTSAMFGFASVIGPTLGGYLTDSFSWRWVFYVNLPVGLIALVVLWFTLPWRRRIGVQHAIDYLGVATLVAGVVPLLLAFVWVDDQFAWFAPQFFGLLIASVALLAAFVLVERRAAEPILPLPLFKNRTFVSGAIIMFFSGMAMFGATVYMPLFMVTVRNASATRAGLTVIPMTLSIVLTSVISGQIVSRTGRYRYLIIGGATVMMAGTFLLATLGVDTHTVVIYLCMIPVGAGVGLSMPIITIVVQNALPYRVLGTVTSATQFFRSIGSTIGVAIFGSILTTRLASEIPNRLPVEVRTALPPASLKTVQDPKVLLSPVGGDQLAAAFQPVGQDAARLLGLTTEALRHAFAASLSDLFLIGGAVAIIAFVTTFTMQEVPLRTAHSMEGEDDAVDGRTAVALPSH